MDPDSGITATLVVVAISATVLLSWLIMGLVDRWMNKRKKYKRKK